MDNFENIQLYRTNVLLGGNMKYDLVLDDNGRDLYVKEFHITPITGNDAIGYDPKSYLLNTTHQENVKKFYNSNKSNFYNENLDPYLKGEWPIIYDEYNTVKPYDDNYFMGLRRTKNYTRYNKQYEFLVPLWIEKFDKKIKFEIQLYKGKTRMTTKSLVLQPFNEDATHNSQEHMKICNYIYDYAKHIGLADKQKIVTSLNADGTYEETEDTVTGGSNYVYDVNLKDKTVYVHGLNINTTAIDSKCLYEKSYELFTREIPFQDFNVKITNSFKESEFITKQLFNFNLCFNIQDIAAYMVYKDMMFEDFNVKVFVYIGNDSNPKKCPLKDFNCNYEYLAKKTTNELYVDGGILHNNTIDVSADPDIYNVYDFLKDYKCIDYLYFNKLIQSYPIWSLANNNEYVFNMYSGFAGWHKCVEKISSTFTEKVPTQILHHYGKSFNSDIYKRVDALRNLSWVNYIDMTEQDSFLWKFWNNNNLIEKNCTLISSWMNDMYYEYFDNFSKTHKANEKSILEGKYLLLCKLSAMNSKLIQNGIKINIDDVSDFLPVNFEPVKNLLGDNKELYICKINNVIVICSTSEHLLTYASVKTLLNAYIKAKEIVKEIVKELYYELSVFLNSLKQPDIISFRSGVDYQKVIGPTVDVDEIEYYKNDEYDNYLYRYGGNIKPQFIDSNNSNIDSNIDSNIFYYKNIRSIEDSLDDKYIDFGKYSRLNYIPNYKSIGYYSLESMDLKYDEYPFPEGDINQISCNVEYSWFNDSKLLILPEEYTGEYITQTEDHYLIILEFLKTFVPESEDVLVVKYQSKTKSGGVVEKYISVPLNIVNIISLYDCNVEYIDTIKYIKDTNSIDKKVPVVSSTSGFGELIDSNGEIIDSTKDQTTTMEELNNTISYIKYKINMKLK